MARSILFLTNAEHGQANVALAVISELLLQSDLDIHLGSWAMVEERLNKLHLRLHTANALLHTRRVTFHPAPGLSYAATITGPQKLFSTVADIPHPPGFRGMPRVRSTVPYLMAPWGPKEHLQLFDWCAELAKDIQPAITVIDTLLLPAHDMVRTLNLKYVVLNPVTIAGALRVRLPYAQALWKYPGPISGLPYPLPWLKIPESLYCLGSMIWALVVSDHLKKLNEARKSHGITTGLGTLELFVDGVPHISPALTKIGLPLPLDVPSDAHMLGPIILPYPPLHESDPTLFEWLIRAPTVFINLGSHQSAGTVQARELALGILQLLDARPDVQILWKLKVQNLTDESDVETILDQEIKAGKVRIENWLDCDPVAILASGNVIFSVHHGGANSYFEACWAGVPQIVLAQWYDTYDQATLVEYLGIGVCGNRSTAPEIFADEFGKALVQVAGTSNKVNPFKERAAEIGRICQKSGGREAAAELVIKLSTGASITEQIKI